MVRSRVQYGQKDGAHSLASNIAWAIDAEHESGHLLPERAVPEILVELQDTPLKAFGVVSICFSKSPAFSRREAMTRLAGEQRIPEQMKRELWPTLPLQI